MNSPRWCATVALLALWLSTSSSAQVAPDLHTVQVPVAAQGAADLQRAEASALRELAVRLSGRSDAASHAAIKAAATAPERYVQQYRYERNPAASADSTAPPWLVQLRFSPAAAAALLRDAGLPLWGPGRPALQMWVVVDDGQTRRFVEADDAAITMPLQQQAQRRGVVIQFPPSRAGVTENAIAQLDAGAVVAAIRPAPGELLLLGHLHNIGGSWRTRWRLAGAGQSGDAQADAGTVDEAVQVALDRLIDGFAAQYAVAAVGAEEILQLRVIGIGSFDDYIALLRYVQELSAVKSATPVLVAGDEVTLQLKAEVDVEQLRRQFALDARLAPVADAGPAQLQYRWSGQR